MVDEINKKIIDAKSVQYTKQVQNKNNEYKSDAELQKFAAQMLANLYDNCADVLDEYNKNRGIADVGTYLEGARKIIDWASFGNIKSTSHIKDSLREKAKELKNINTNDSEAFKKRFKELSGVEYNEENIRNFMALVNKEGVNTESEDFKEACYKAFGLKGPEKQQKYVKHSSFVDGIGDIVLMLVTLGAVSKTKMMGKLTSKLYKSLEQGASKFLKGNKTEKAAKLGTSMIMGGATLAGFTLSKETLDNLSNPTRDAKSFSTWKQTGIASLESFGFGAFGGLLNETVVAPVVKYIAKPGKQATQAVSRALSGNTELSGKEILQTATKAQNLNMSGLFKMNAVELKDFAQILGAHAAGFGVEVVGFAGYEAGLDAIKDICDPQTGRLPEDMTLANLTKYLGHKIGDQFSNLGTIKGISQLLMMSKGGKAAQNAMMNKMIADSEKLNDVKFKKVNQNGNEAIEMTLPDGSKKLVSSPNQAIQTCQTLMQMEFVVNNLKPEEETKPNPEEVKTEEDKAEPISEDKPETKTDSTEPIIEESNPKTGQEEISVPKEEKPKGQKVIEDSVPESELKPAEENQEQIINTEPKVKTETTEVINDKPVPANETEANPVIEEINIKPKLTEKEFQIRKQKLLQTARKDKLMYDVGSLDWYINPANLSLAEELYNNGIFPKDEIGHAIEFANEENISLAEQICMNQNFSASKINSILFRTKKHNLSLAKKLCSDSDFPKEYIPDILYNANVDFKIPFAEKICFDKDFPKELIKDTLKEILYEEDLALADELYKDKNFPNAAIKPMVRVHQLYEDIYSFANESLYKNKNFPREHLANILEHMGPYNFELAQKLCLDKNFPKEYIAEILNKGKVGTYPLAEKLCFDKNFPKDIIADTIAPLGSSYKDVLELAEKLCFNKGFPKQYIPKILENIRYSYSGVTEFTEKLCFNKNYPKNLIADTVKKLNSDKIPFAEKLCFDENFPKEYIPDIINNLSCEDNVILFAEKLCFDSDIPKKSIAKILAKTRENNLSEAIRLCENYKKLEIEPEQISVLLDTKNEITYDNIRELNIKMGRDKAISLSDKDLALACKFIKLFGLKNINEIPIKLKKDLLHKLVSNNTGLFEISDDLSKDFPLIPRNQEEYCSLLPSIVRSLGIETNELTPEQRITMFNNSIGELSKSLAKIPDTDFSKMTITQEYSKDKFIVDILNKVKDLSKAERQKVYDYFGFELHHNKENSTGFSITGYPVNLNNGKKLAQIEDPRTKAIVEDLRPDIIRFSEHNKIKCNNPEIEQFLNEVIDALPELRTTIGKKQHGTQAFDVMQHSLKVMQKITQDINFTKLSESDKKVMLLASLMHDITKSEGRIDKTHANESSFDTYFIAQKFKLSKEEEIKLHTLIKHHEWLELVNTSKSEEQLTKNLQSVAYDLQQGNLFDMAEIFTHADLRAVRVDDSFHDTKEGKSRIGFDGTVRSFGESADIYSKKIREYILELKKSQPLLPQTKFPRASRINKAITQVNPDGSTNIKGVYKDKDGLIVIKFNEIENWEAIGFPKGSISHGIKAKGLNENIDTGNIKFFVHGLDYANQLAKFDAFSLVDSDALLSVSYAERPESKYRFFRPQGVLLDVDSKYIHGGGNTDAGSGKGKSIVDFKEHYIFGGGRESDRLFISDLIKEATGMSDEQYLNFFEKNQNKSLSEIEPVKIRNKIIQAFATINSNTRTGNREYNEMYISNPNEVMGVFAYSLDYKENIDNPINFLNRTTIGENEKVFGAFNSNEGVSVKERTEFLRKYALERNLPFIIFGD